ncbi:histone-lysine N-methyltransferase SUV39H2-like [Clavelina lepadiformis]|uniref:Histone-lysine N-methyltransferase n=1 Tax=Clavelina lepadiformis TaxID=159417 RepID=A0ABP0GC00_CLALP
MEPPTKKIKIEKAAVRGKGPVVSCYTVIETLQQIASKQGVHFDVVHPRKRKHSMPYAETYWFYDSGNLVNSNGIINHKKTTASNGCKTMLIKAHQLKARKMQTSKKSSNSLFEVEYIANFKVIESKRYYLVKWVGWPMEANTWEPICNLSCSSLIQEFHEEYMMQLDKFMTKKNLHWEKLIRPGKLCRNITQRMFDMIPNNFHFHAEYATKKQKLHVELMAWQKKINSINGQKPLLAIENEVDLEPFPSNFTWIVNNIPGKGVTLPVDPLLGCNCVDGCGNNLDKGGCCPGVHKGRFAYGLEDRFIRIKPGKPIFECNSRCKCGPNCSNRVVQRGPQYAISLFKTPNGKGWGVKALQPIPKGAFVMEYVGEIITNEEAERRGKEYDSCGITYLFDLDFYDSQNPLTVDATNFGNMSHFVNHSCSPNLQVYNVFIDNLDPSLPRIALFARKNIGINEELTFDYQMTGDMTDGREDIVTNINDLSSTAVGGSTDDNSSENSFSACSSIKKRTRCLCGSSNCRMWLI